MRRRKLLDLFSGSGGASRGYDLAGFDVTGCDQEEHPEYPYPMIVGDAMSVLACPDILAGFDVVTASPPCPRYSQMTPAEHRDSHPDLVQPVREALQKWGGVYVIENVPNAPLLNPVRLCGTTFGLPIWRHRLFETNAPMLQPECDHRSQPKVYGIYGDGPYSREFRRPDGKRRGDKARSVAHAQEIMGIDWMTEWDDLADAIPPAYTEYIGARLLDFLS